MHLELNGRRIAYRRAGKGPPLLFLHAFPLSRAQWEIPMAALAPENTTVALDFPGFGGSAPLPEEEASIARFAEAAEAVAHAVSREGPWVLCGMSMGGYVAFEMVRRGRVHLRGLVLADTRATADGPQARAARDAAIASVRDRGTAALVDAQLPKMISSATDDETRRAVERRMRQAPPEAVLGALRALRDRPDSTATLAEIRVPVLCVVGEEDPVTPPEEVEAMASTIAGARLVRIPGASHFASVDQPEAFLDAVGSFLRSLDGSG